MPIFKALHILSMIAMVTIEIAWSSSTRSPSRGVTSAGSRPCIGSSNRRAPARRGIAALVSGVVFGLLTAATGGFDFLDGWLIAAYVLLIVLIVTTTVFLRPALRLGRAAVEAEEGHGASEDVVREMAAHRTVLWFAIDVVVVVAFVVDMVLKRLRPAGWQSRPPLCPDPKPLRRDSFVGEITRRVTPLEQVARVAADGDPDTRRVMAFHEQWRADGYREVLKLLGAKAELRPGIDSTGRRICCSCVSGWTSTTPSSTAAAGRMRPGSNGPYRRSPTRCLDDIPSAVP